MKIYQVGGSVRDELLGLDASDKDYVVVGSTAAEMVAAGYKPVGKDFPVFLHPVTHEEYALARTERKQSVGYGGFSFFADPTVSLEEDLTRRDLTVNAIAKDEQGVLIDPHGGRADLEARIFRHVSPAFAEDPLRVIRLARFLARFPDFSVADETLDLVKKVVASGEIAHLTQERLWQEWRQGLMTGRPDRMIRFLTDVDALDVALGVPTPRSARSQRLDEMLDVLMAAVADRKPLPLRLLILFFVDDETEPIGPTLLRLPKEIVELARLFSSTDQAVTALFDRSPKSMQRLLRRADPQRRPGRFSQWLSLIEDYDRYRPRLANRKATLSTLSEAASRIVALDRSAYHGLSAAEIVARRERAETEICAEALADHAEREAGPPEELERHGL